MAKLSKKAASKYKHAAGKSSTYSREVVDMIYRMAREGIMREPEAFEYLAEKIRGERSVGVVGPTPPSLDHLVFLAANLTRLVIDPYREACRSETIFGARFASQPLNLSLPLVIGGFEFSALSDAARHALLEGAADAALPVNVGANWESTEPFGSGLCVIVQASLDAPPTETVASALELVDPHRQFLTNPSSLQEACHQWRERTGGEKPLGLLLPSDQASEGSLRAVEAGFDFVTLDGTWAGGDKPLSVCPENAGIPRFWSLVDAIEALRRARAEGDIDVVYSGGARNGADVAKCLALGATAVAIGKAALIALGCKVTLDCDRGDCPVGVFNRQSSPPPGWEKADRAHRVHNFIKSLQSEVEILARACGKTKVHNLEPEDLRSLTPETSAVTGIPCTGKDWNFRLAHQPHLAVKSGI